MSTGDRAQQLRSFLSGLRASEELQEHLFLWFSAWSATAFATPDPGSDMATAQQGASRWLQALPSQGEGVVCRVSICLVELHAAAELSPDTREMVERAFDELRNPGLRSREWPDRLVPHVIRALRARIPIWVAARDAVVDLQRIGQVMAQATTSTGGGGVVHPTPLITAVVVAAKDPYWLKRTEPSGPKGPPRPS